MDRFPLTVVALVSWTLMSVACSRGPARADASKPIQSSDAAAGSLEPKTLITDEKIGKYIVYQREMNTVSALMLELAGQALTQSDSSQKGIEKALSGDERTRKIAETQASALSKSGLTQMEAMEIAKIVSTYTPGATMGDDDMKREARQEFLKQFGPEVLSALEKRLAELSKLQDESLEAALGKKK